MNGKLVKIVVFSATLALVGDGVGVRVETACDSLSESVSSGLADGVKRVVLMLVSDGVNVGAD